MPPPAAVSGSGSDGGEGAGAAAAAAAPRAQWAAFPTTAVGRVMAAEANYVRVDVHRMGPPTPAELERGAAAWAAAAAGGAHAGGGSAEAGQDSNHHHHHQQQQQQEGAPAAEQAAEQQQQQQQEQQPPRRQLLCTVRALLKKVRQRVLVGDAVSVGGVDWGEGRGVVEAVLPRASELSDPAVANVDHVVLVFGLTQPPFEEQQVSRFLVSIEAAGLPLTLALNKADLVPEAEVEARVAQCAAWGYDAVPISCASGQGLERLGAALAGRTAVVAGPSGAGKSSLINALRLGRHRADEGGGDGDGDGALGGFGGGDAWGGGGEALRRLEEDSARVLWAASGSNDGSGEGPGRADAAANASADAAEEPGEAQQPEPARGDAGAGADAEGTTAPGDFLAVGDVSRFGRGRHTTRVVRLIPLPGGGLVADTPGFGLPTLDGVASAGLADLFPEFRAAVRAAGGRCRFDDCMHVAEPGCAVSSAEFERYPFYLKLLTEVKAREDYDVRVMQLAKKQREGAVKVKTGRGGEARFEARLESKKHRVTSRKRAKQGLLRAAAAEEEDEEQQHE